MSIINIETATAKAEEFPGDDIRVNKIKDILNDYEVAVNELNAIERSEGLLPDHRYKKLLGFASDRCDALLNQLYPEYEPCSTGRKGE